MSGSLFVNRGGGTVELTFLFVSPLTWRRLALISRARNYTKPSREFGYWRASVVRSAP
jgi:hypothetical protein